MAVQTHQIVEVDCAVDSLDKQTVRAFIDENSAATDDALEERVEKIAAACCEALRPRGVYKLFNPATCTLPPSYTEPGIKLVGTMAVLRGKTIYDRMRRATHCVMMATSVGSPECVNALRARLCRDAVDEAVFEACLQAMGAWAERKTSDAVAREAHELGLHVDEALQAGEYDFPLESNTQLLFYTQATNRLGFACDKSGAIAASGANLGVMGMYDASQRNRKRACGRCRNRERCSIRAIGMNCHGRRGKFKE
ncbi:MAG: phage tail protein [Eggerthellaceae bacterium]|nr:phage tail protein [Eggerthellaceae bacterium]